MSHAVFLDLTVSPEQSELLRWTEWRAFAVVRAAEGFRRQDELRDLVLRALRGRCPHVLFEAANIVVSFDVSTNESRDQMRCTSIAFEIANYLNVADEHVLASEIVPMHNLGIPDRIETMRPVSLDDLRRI